jgi:hypothetical protein
MILLGVTEHEKGGNSLMCFDEEVLAGQVGKKEGRRWGGCRSIPFLG